VNTEAKQSVSGCNGTSFGDHSVLDGDCILPSHGQALKQECCIPAGGKVPADLLCHPYGHVMMSCHVSADSIALANAEW